MADAIEVLSKVPLFSSVPAKDLRELAKAANEVRYQAGKQISTRDESGVGFFVLVEGEAEVSARGGPPHRLRAGDYFGEMSIIDRAPRSADVVAATDLTCLVFTQWNFRPFLRDHPDVSWALLEVMAQRVRDAEARAAGEAGGAR